MEPDDLDQLWQQYDARLASIAPDPFVVRDRTFARVRTTIGRLQRGLVFEAICDAIAIVFLGGFSADHFAQRNIFAAAAILDVFAIAMFVSVIAQLIAATRLDVAAPVLPTARALSSLRLLRARVVFTTLAVAPLMWLPLLIVAFAALSGVDVTEHVSPAWTIGNLAFGVVVLGGALLLARRFRSAAGRPAILQRILDALSGREISDAQQFLRGLVAE
jgi:hypothetical protein